MRTFGGEKIVDTSNSIQTIRPERKLGRKWIGIAIVGFLIYKACSYEISKPLPTIAGQGARPSGQAPTITERPPDREPGDTAFARYIRAHGGQLQPPATAPTPDPTPPFSLLAQMGNYTLLQTDDGYSYRVPFGSVFRGWVCSRSDFGRIVGYAVTDPTKRLPIGFGVPPNPRQNTSLRIKSGS